MKKLLSKINKKVKCSIGIIVLLVLIAADAKCSQTIKKDQQEQCKDEVSVVQDTEKPETEPVFDTYEKLNKEYKTDTENKEQSSSEQSENSKAPDSEDDIDDRKLITGEDIDKSGGSNKKVVIDESSETVNDQTSDEREKEYCPEDEAAQSDGKFELKEPKAKEGKDVNGDISAGGKQGVGTWS